MKELNIALLLLFIEITCLNGHTLKRTSKNVDTYKIKEDMDKIEIINPKAKKPTLREIIYYHVIEKPYPGKHVTNDESNNFGSIIRDVTRPFTNGHGYQYLNLDNDETELKENKKPKEIEAKLPNLDNNKDTKEKAKLLNDEILKDDIKDKTFEDQIINDKEKERSNEKIDAVKRRKRDIDYSEIGPAPPLPAFRMDILPGYIKNILPNNDDLATELPRYERTRPEVRGTTESPEDTDYPEISIRIGSDEESDHKIIKKSPLNVDEDIEKQIREVIQQVADDGKKQRDENYPPSYGMELLGNGGFVWNDLNNQHIKYNVGPDANDEEVHNAQIPVTNHEDHAPEDKEVANEIETALNEIQHILEEIKPNNVNSQEYNNKDNNIEEATTESNDIEIHINKKPNTEPTETNEDLNNDKIELKSINDPQNTFDLESALNLLEVLQDIVANADKSESNNDSNRDDSEMGQKSLTNPDRERKHKPHKGEGDKDIEDLLNNDKYWEKLRDTLEDTLKSFMEKINAFIKEELTKQIEDLAIKLKEESINQIPESNPEKDDSDTKPENAPETDESEKEDKSNEETKNDALTTQAETDSKKEHNKSQNEIKSKSHKDDASDIKVKKQKDKHTNEKAPLLNIDATNSYGSAIGNKEVTNIFIFNINGSDLSNFKPFTNGSGIFIFGAQDNKNTSDNNSNSNVSPMPNNNKDEEVVFLNVEDKPADVVEQTDIDSNKESDKGQDPTTISPVDTEHTESSSNEDIKDEEGKDKDKNQSTENHDESTLKEETPADEGESSTSKGSKKDSNDEPKHNTSVEDEKDDVAEKDSIIKNNEKS